MPNSSNSQIGAGEQVPSTKEQGYVVRYSYRLAMVKRYEYRGTLFLLL